MPVGMWGMTGLPANCQKGDGEERLDTVKLYI